MTSYRDRFKSWRFYVLIVFVLADFAIPYVPLTALALLAIMFSNTVDDWLAWFLTRAFYPKGWA